MVDYHALSRKELQALCKQHKIPANKTNLFMADSLAALLGVSTPPGDSLHVLLWRPGSCFRSPREVGLGRALSQDLFLIPAICNILACEVKATL